MRASIIYTHWASTPERSELMRKSIDSLLRTAPDAEILVSDNGGSLADSQFLLELTDQQKIAVYTRYRKNVHFAYARNAMLQKATGDFLVICDNDIHFEEGWLEECIEFLVKHPGKYLATPLCPDPQSSQHKHRAGQLDGWFLNHRAGSSCFVYSRASYEEIGLFQLHNVSGSKYVDRYNRMGYLMASPPVDKAVDMGVRKGYDWKSLQYSTVL